MPDPNDRSTAAVNPLATAAVRVVADRLAAQTSTWNGRPSAGPSWPPWPVGSTPPPQPAAPGSAPGSVTPPAPAPLDRSVLGRPSLAAGASAPRSTGSADSPGSSAQSQGEPATNLAAGPVASDRPATVVPTVPGAASGSGGFGGGAISHSASGRPSISAGGVASPAAGLALTAMSGGQSFSSAQGTGNSASEPPGVRGRLPAMLSSLAIASPGATDGPGMGHGAGFQFATDGGSSGFGSVDSAANGGGGGAVMDLSKTNDLLQQLLDAVRQRKSGSNMLLPSGSSAVYAGRS